MEDRRLGKSLQPHPSLMGWGFCVRQRNISFEDIVTNEHRGDSNIAVRRNDMRTYYLMTQDLKT